MKTLAYKYIHKLKHAFFLCMFARVIYGCVCAHQVYMYVRVFIGVYAWIKFICMCVFVVVGVYACM